MINQKYVEMLSKKSVIRELSEYATARGKEIGYENVFDYSLGNPSVPVPDSYTRAIIDLHKNEDSISLHGYSPSLGNPIAKEVVASSLRKRFGLPYEAGHIFMTSGAAGALAHALRAVTIPGDEILVIAPYFSEYIPYIVDTGAVPKIVRADVGHFQINWESFDEQMNPRVMAVLINSPNNPSGAVYSEETLKKLSDYLKGKAEEYGHEIFIISDEPYREIAYDAIKVPYPASFYDDTMTCYSFSKSLSIPGERIGYVAVSPRAKEADRLVPIFGQISRGIGHNCPSSSVQLAVARVIEETSDLSVYEENCRLLYECLKSLGLEVEKPSGTFYIFPKALEDDAVAFCKKALKYDLIMVPSDGFGVQGYFRIAYCVDTKKVVRSLSVIEKFIKECY